jgi:uncharacterized protein with HEPN domain
MFQKIFYMSERDVNLLLEDIIESIKNIENYTADVNSFTEFIDNNR